MAFTTTTLSTAMAATDVQMIVASATSFAANQYLKVDDEFMKIVNSYVSGTTIPVMRGQNGTTVRAHAKTANVVTDAISQTVASDWTGPNASVVTPYPLAARRRRVDSYTTAGAITLPASGEDVFAILNGTSTLAMTIAAPTTDMDGAMLVVVGNGAAAHTVQFTGGLSGAGASYDVITVNATAPIACLAFAVNGLWIMPIAPAMTGTVTNITGGVA